MLRAVKFSLSHYSMCGPRWVTKVCYYIDVFASLLFYSGFIKSSYEETTGFQLQFLCSQLVIEIVLYIEPGNLLQHKQHEKSEKFFLFVSTCASIFFSNYDNSERLDLLHSFNNARKDILVCY